MGRYHHLEARDFVLAAHYYRAAADRGHPPSCSALGLLYRTGATGFPQDLSNAFSYFKMAADAGDADGCVALGGMWEAGHGVVLVSMTTGVLQQDLAEAVRLYKAAADHGHAEGQSNLGRMYPPRLKFYLLLPPLVFPITPHASHGTRRTLCDTLLRHAPSGTRTRPACLKTTNKRQSTPRPPPPSASF